MNKILKGRAGRRLRYQGTKHNLQNGWIIGQFRQHGKKYETQLEGVGRRWAFFLFVFLGRYTKDISKHEGIDNPPRNMTTYQPPNSIYESKIKLATISPAGRHRQQTHAQQRYLPLRDVLMIHQSINVPDDLHERRLLLNLF